MSHNDTTPEGTPGVPIPAAAVPPSTYAPPIAYPPAPSTQAPPVPDAARLSASVSGGPTSGVFAGGRPTASSAPTPSAYGARPVPTGGYQPPIAPAVATAPDSAPRRNTRVGIVAALAVGALVGGLAGGGVVAVTMSSGASTGTPVANGPTNITVNDPANATTVTAVAATAGPSVVTISVSDPSGSGGTGSGVILSDDGYVVTNTHVVTLDGASSKPTVTVQTFDGRIFQAKVIGTDPVSDLAVVKIDNGTSRFQAAEFADSSKLNVGDIAVAIGAPLGLSNTVTNGIISSLNRSITVASSAAPTDSSGEAPSAQSPFDFWQTNPNTQTPQTASSRIALTVIQTDAAINPGNSGGALLDSSGKVIGINVAIASAPSTGASTSGSIGVGFAIPANLAKRIASEIIKSGTGTHGLLGASVEDVDPATATVVGALLQSVTGGGAAEAGGLKAGDVVTAINGLPVTGKNDLTAQVRALAAGSKATVTYVRGGKSTSTDVTLGTLK